MTTESPVKQPVKQYVAFTCQWCGATVAEIQPGTYARGRCPRRDCRMWTEVG